MELVGSRDTNLYSSFYVYRKKWRVIYNGYFGSHSLWGYKWLNTFTLLTHCCLKRPLCKCQIKMGLLFSMLLPPHFGIHVYSTITGLRILILNAHDTIRREAAVWRGLILEKLKVTQLIQLADIRHECLLWPFPWLWEQSNSQGELY